MNKKKQLSQYYTPAPVASFLAQRALSHLHRPPSNVLELAAGDGQLLAGLVEFVPDCKATAVDLDSENVSYLKEKYPSFNVIQANALDDIEVIQNKGFDLGLANPPFISFVQVTPHIKKLLSEILNISISEKEKIRSEIVFICQYLKLIKEDGVLSIIIPSSIISGSRTKSFRSSLIKSFKIVEVIYIDGFDFFGTEAETFIMTIKKSKPEKEIPIITKNINSKNEIKKVISTLDAEERIDPKFYLKENSNMDSKLYQFASITRGSITHKSLKELNCNYIHSTNLMNYKKTKNKIPAGNFHIAKSGDILMCRVGKRVIGKAIEYQGGDIIYSDCIYRIRFNCEDKKSSFISFINSELGKNEISRISKGVCSKYITISDLKNLNFG